jgi:hypothetical protein
MRSVVWPSVREYTDAVGDPNALGDPALRAATPEYGHDGRPAVYSGTFAATYRFATSSGDVALRCFLRANGDLATRYTAIADVLRFVHNDALCPVRFLAHGIRVRAEWWPAVEMTWVAGRPLNVAIESRLASGDALQALATTFREMMRSLEIVGIAHGDLQHANILVGSAGLRLIDYDSMFVPALSGHAQTEYGHPNYQHPQRAHATFDGRLDRFSSLVIYTALVALSVDPSLWARFNDGKNMLFRAHDFVSNGESELFASLRAHNATRALAETLLAACRASVDDVPTLEQTIDRSSGTMPALGPGTAPFPAAIRSVPRAREERTQAARRSPARWFVIATVVGLAIGMAIASWPHLRAPVVSLAPTALTIASTYAPTAAPTERPTVAATLGLPAGVGLSAQLQGPWEIDESNVRIGPMVWSTDAAVFGSSLTLNAHKASVAGRLATPCERATALRIVVALGGAQQTVPFRETNCAGVTSMGEVRVTQFAHSGRSFSGTFWEGGNQLGAFTATKK